MIPSLPALTKLIFIDYLLTMLRSLLRWKQGHDNGLCSFPVHTCEDERRTVPGGVSQSHRHRTTRASGERAVRCRGPTVGRVGDLSLSVRTRGVKRRSTERKTGMSLFSVLGVACFFALL